MSNSVDIKNECYGTYNVDGKDLPNHPGESGNGEENKREYQVDRMSSTITGYTPQK